MAECCDNFILDEAQDDFGFSGGIGGTLPISMGGTGAQTAEEAALNIIGPLPTVSGALDEYDKVLFQQNGTGSIRKRRADAFAQDMWDLLYKDAAPIEDSTAPITSGAVYQALGGIFSPVKYATPGALVHIEDGGYNQPVQGMRIAINPVQDMHGYDHPWPGGGGVNKLPTLVTSATTLNGVTWTPGAQGTMTASGTASTRPSQILSGNIPVTAEQDFYLSGCPSGGSATTYYLRVLFYDAGGSVISAGTKTDEGAGVTGVVPSNASYAVCFASVNAGTAAPSGTWYPMLVLGSSTATDYQPYENLCPISGWDAATVTRTGKNLLNTSKYQFNTKTVYLGTSTNPTKGYIYLTAGTYSLSAETLVISKFFIQADGEAAQGLGSGTTNPQVSFTVAEDNYYKIWLYQNSQLLISDIEWVQLEKNPTVTAYEPYKGEVYEVSFSSAGTVYGGTLTGNGDGTWTLIVDHYTMTVTGNDITTTVNLGDVIRTNLVYVESGKNSTGRNATAISNWLPRIAANYSGNAPGFYFDSNTRIYIKVPNNAVGVTGETSGEDRLALTKAFFDDNPFFVVYPLATPLTYTLTAPEVTTLLGINNIWADCGEIEELAYRADIGLYLTAALNPIKEMLAYREDTMRATRAYTAGDFIVVGDTFYKAAVSIANGATLTPGTNVNATTVGAQLKLLS